MGARTYNPTTDTRLERRGPSDKRRLNDYSRTNRFLFDYERAQVIPHAHFTRERIKSKTLSLEIDFYSARIGDTEKFDGEQWEEEKMTASNPANREGFRELYRMARCLLGKRIFYNGGVAWLPLPYYRQPRGPIRVITIEAFGPHVCRVCGCTDDHACPEGCYWVEANKDGTGLCSACADKEGQ